jgi:hypothetical protein
MLFFFFSKKVNENLLSIYHVGITVLIAKEELMSS